MYRWLNDAGVRLASEKNQRALSSELVPTRVVGEAAPFTHALKGGGEAVKPAAMAYVAHIGDKVFELLDQYAR